ncbi:hypothetical protein MMC30_001307 [Trapelia coarctata]|nr:hypothetical protein [Trapelia coarctata]
MTIPVPSAGPSPSALTTLIANNPAPSTASPHHHALALQILHNLQCQHDWTDIRLHYHSPLASSQDPTSPTFLPRPLISGLPPTRIYIHPDEQVELLKAGKKGKELGEVKEREWVLPSHIREKWSLRRFAECFDRVGEIPEGGETVGGVGDHGVGMRDKGGVGIRGEGEDEIKEKKRRGGKRMLLATVCDDSTVVYYIVHDGIVKPRQN